MIETLRKCHRQRLEDFGLETLSQEVDRLRSNRKSNHHIIGSLRKAMLQTHRCPPEYIENALWAYLSRYTSPKDTRDMSVSLTKVSLCNPRISHRVGTSIPKRVKRAMRYLSSTSYSVNQRVAKVLRTRIDNERLWDLVDNVGTRDYWMEAFADWRLRLYTDSQALLSFQGDDINRALTQFSKAMRVSKEDLKVFLEIIEDEYGLTIDKIREIDRDPDGYLDNTEDRKPACTMAAAFAYVEAEKTGYSRYIVQQDATCSGFQHISLLLRDRYLAKLVNVYPNRGKRRDLYKQVIRRLLNTSKKEWVKVLKEIPVHVLRADLAKDTVILTGYGSGDKPLALEFAGFSQPGDKLTYEEVIDMILQGENIKLNPAPCLRKILEGKNNIDTLKTCLDIAEELQKTLFAIAPTIKTFINALRGRAVSVYKKSDGKTTFKWTSPNGYQIDLLGYTPSKDHEVRTVCTTIDGDRKRINILKMVEGDCASQAPPCVVHTWDAHVIHEMAIAGEENDIQLAMIHDSIGCHICNVGWVQGTYSNTMIDAHEEEHLNNILLENNGKPLTLGDLDIQECRASRMLY